MLIICEWKVSIKTSELNLLCQHLRDQGKTSILSVSCIGIQIASNYLSYSLTHIALTEDSHQLSQYTASTSCENVICILFSFGLEG